MNNINLDDIDHEALSAEVRIRLAARLEKFLENLEPFVDPRAEESMGQVHPALGQLYLAGIKAMGRLYQVEKAPAGQDMVPAGKVEKMLEQARIEAAAAAVEEFRSLRELESRQSFEQSAAKLREVLEAGRS